jgi:hypothetical protein
MVERRREKMVRVVNLSMVNGVLMNNQSERGRR